MRKVAGIVAVIATVGSATTRAQDVSAEYRVKAAFLYNFVKFVEWPAEAPAGALAICVAGRNPFGTVLTDLLREMSEGEIYNTIANGSANKVMYPYADKLSPEDRWAVVAYVRALQRAQQGKAADAADAAAKSSLGIP